MTVVCGTGFMKAIFRGRRHYVVSQTDDGVWLQPFDGNGERRHVGKHDPDLIVDPTSEDLYLAEAFERDEIRAFEYPDGHTYPPNQEIPGRKVRNGVTRLH